MRRVELSFETYDTLKVLHNCREIGIFANENIELVRPVMSSSSKESTCIGQRCVMATIHVAFVSGKKEAGDGVLYCAHAKEYLGRIQTVSNPDEKVYLNV